MAQRTITRLVDDIDGTEIEGDAGQTVKFGLDGRDYEIDLSNENADGLRSALSRYVDAARKVGGRTMRNGSAKSSAKSDISPQAVREWAKFSKVEVSARGRIPQSVIEQFRAAGN